MTVNQISQKLMNVWHSEGSCHIQSDGRFYFTIDGVPTLNAILQDRAFIEAGAIPDENEITPSTVFYKIPNFNTEMFVDRVRLLERFMGRKASFWSDCIIFAGTLASPGGRENEMRAQKLKNFGFPLEKFVTCGPCGFGMTVNELMSIPEYEFSPLRDDYYRISVSSLDYKGNIVTHLCRSMTDAMDSIKSILSWAINCEMDDPDEERVNNILNGVTLNNYREVANKWGITVQLTEHWN